jgi:hypothetical protein
VCQAWPAIKGRGGPGRLRSLRGRVRPGAQAAERSYLGASGGTPGGAGDRGDQPAAIGGRAAGHQAGHRPRLLHRTHRGRRGGGRKGFTEADYAALLDAAHQQLGGPIVLIWDNLSTHTSTAMAELIAARPWLTVYRLPPYAHELNPVEPVWAHLKQSLANLTKQTIAELTVMVKTRLRRMQYRPGLLAGFLGSTGLEYGPFL